MKNKILNIIKKIRIKITKKMVLDFLGIFFYLFASYHLKETLLLKAKIAKYLNEIFLKILNYF